MNIRVPIAILACRAVRLAARVLHKGGTAKPGEIALKICPDLLGYVSRGVKTVVVTGTNGKTTTARMIEQAFADSGLDYIANRSGANLISGITTEFALRSSLSGRCRCGYAVIECDEAACRRTLAYLKPHAVLVTNLFRDQLDRFGDVTVTLENIREGLAHVPETIICLNADCSLTASLAELPNRHLFYGIDASAMPPAEGGPDTTDVTHCLRCGAEYEYSYLTFGHLGGYRCPECGYARPHTDVGVSGIGRLGSSSSTVSMRVGNETSSVSINLPAVYNIYNAAGATAALCATDFDADIAFRALERFECGFGRMERFPLGHSGARMMLVKNPAGCNQVIDFLSGIDERFHLVICLNDKTGDGTDISWIWETNFEKFALLGERLSGVTVSGIRWADMALRLKYAGIPEEKISAVADYTALVEKLSAMEENVYIIPTYSAMLELRSAIVAKTGGSEFWEG